MNLNVKRLLLTGATGSIGPYLLPQLLDAGWEVVVLGRTRPLLEHSRLIFKQFDLLSDDDFSGLTSGCDTVLHMANLSKTDLERDFRATDLLATDAVAQGVKHFFYTSSIRVYGRAYGVVDERSVARPHPLDAYGRNKLRIEKHLEAKFAGSGVQLRVLRVGHVISQLSVAKLPVRLSVGYLLFWGRCFPHFISVGDVCGAVGFLLEKRGGLKWGCYNITREDGVRRSYNDFFAFRLLGWKRFLVKTFAVSRLVAWLFWRRVDEAQGTRSALILGLGLLNEGWAGWKGKVEIGEFDLDL